jgi:hypothetical protein
MFILHKWICLSTQINTRRKQTSPALPSLSLGRALSETENMKGYEMKALCWITFSASLIIVISLDIVRAFQWYQAKKVMAVLDLADDASMPAKKAEFLDKFVDEIQSRNLPEYGAFIWKTEQNKISNQIIVLQSLSDRCKELIGKDPESMGYATGIQQITGQEFDHAIESIGKIIYKSLMMKYGWFMFYQVFWTWIIPLVMLLVSIGASVE